MALLTPFVQGISGSVDVVDSNMISFKGFIKQGKRTGQGVMKFSCGTIYDGGHENDKFHGQATITLPNGETYEAEYKRGWLVSDSMSTYTFRDGSVLKGYPAGNTMYDRIASLPDILRERRSKYNIIPVKAEAEAEPEEPEEQEQEEDADYEFWRFRQAMETPYDKAERERVCRKNAEPEDESAHMVPVPRMCVNINYPNRCVNCSGALKSDFFLCTVCNKDFFCTVECFNQHWASHPCNDEK